MIRRSMGQFILGVLVGVLLASRVAAIQPAPLAEIWTKHENLAPVIGADGKPHAATCSAYPGTDPRFSFWTKQGTSKNLVVFFEGGGACFDNFTCTFPLAAGLPATVPQFFVPAIPPNTDPANYDGIFSAQNAANPVKDWTHVYIPYCTGDLHLGSATKQYFNAGHPVFPLPPAFAIEHRGFDNFMVVLDWIRKNVNAPKSVLVAGSSGGGYGASANFPWIQQTYPDAHMYVIADASQGVTTDAFDTGNPGRNSWNPQLAPWVFGTNPSLLVGADLLRVAAQAHPQAKVSQFTTNFDAVQILFYGVMKQFYGPGGSCPSVAVDWNQQMLGTLGEYASDVDNFRFYLAGGTYHTILRSPAFYTENSPGIAYSRWVDAMLKSRGGTGGAGGGDWRDAACPTCLVATPCP